MLRSAARVSRGRARDWRRCFSTAGHSSGGGARAGGAGAASSGSGLPSVQERRRKMMADAADQNPFIASMMQSGGSVGPAEAAIRKYIKEGGLDDLEGAGKPFPDKPPPPPFVDEAEHQLDGVVNRMLSEKDHLEEGEWREAIGKAAVDDIRQQKLKEGAARYFANSRR
uniref:DnaJ homologue subfamily C member 28 conserved domain-containing protein n=1 Tax=Alexandrium monilatum TaxID=311494 RepID=A0A7S4QN33_9DINO